MIPEAIENTGATAETTLAPTVSVVAPAFRERGGIDDFLDRAVGAISGIPGISWEILIVDDGSDDGTFDVVAERASADPRIRAIRLSRNFGHQAALSCGLDNARGDCVVLIDSDLQDPPEVIPRMLEAWSLGADVVHGVRTVRPGESRIMLFAIRSFYKVLGAASDIALTPNSADFKLLDRRVVDELRQIDEPDLYLRGLVAWVGYTQAEVIYERLPRETGKSTYGFGRRIRLAADAILGFSSKPLRIVAAIGAIATAIALAGTLYAIISKILAPNSSLPGYASVIGIVLLLGGIQLLSLALIGEYVGRLFISGKGRPRYLVGDATDLELSRRDRPAIPPVNDPPEGSSGR